jgi:amino acid transporter
MTNFVVVTDLSYARQGLGRRAGGATAYIALLAYNAATIGIFGALAYFASQTSASFGVHVSWQVWALIAYAIVALLAYFEVTLSAKVLGLALAAEVLTLLVFDFAVLARNGFHGFSLDVFKPSVVFAGGFGISLMLAFGSFAGFEATALYGEETRNPHRSVPRATYISLPRSPAPRTRRTPRARPAPAPDPAPAGPAGPPQWQAVSMTAECSSSRNRI